MIRFDGLPSEVIQALCTPMHQILPLQASDKHVTGALFLGALASVQDSDLLKENGITHILHVLDVPHLPPPPPPTSKISTHVIDVLDAPSAAKQLMAAMPYAIEWIDAAMNANGRVLVHCHQGVSRSASVVIGFLIGSKTWGMDYDHAYRLVRDRRSCIKPNSGFVEALRSYSDQMAKKRPKLDKSTYQTERRIGQNRPGPDRRHTGL